MIYTVVWEQFHSLLLMIKKKLLVLSHVQMLKKLQKKWVSIHILNIGILKLQNNY